jgi:chromosome partitioning protein
VGKTTTAVNLAASLAVAEQRTLLIDGDPQGNATSGIGITREQLSTTLYDVLIGETDIASTRHRGVQFKTLDVLPATPDLAGAEIELVDRPHRERAMRDAIGVVRLSQLLNTVHLVQRGMNEHLAIEGVLLTMYDGRVNLSRQVATDAREYFGPKVFDSVVPRNVRLAEAPSFGKPIILYDVASVGSQAYMGLARELLDRHRLEGDGAQAALVQQ